MYNNYINSEVCRISSIIPRSSYSQQYFLYKSYKFNNKSKTISKSLSEDDWNYCLLILNFVNPKDTIKNINNILEYFLRSERYRGKFDQHFSYLRTTISKAIVKSSNSNMLGSLYSLPVKLSKPIITEFAADHLDLVKTNTVASCNARDVLKVSNFFSVFYLHSCPYSNSVLDYELNCNYNFTTCVKISMFGGLLNHFDLTVFLSILYFYKSLGIVNFDNSIDVNFSDINFLLNNNTEHRSKYLKSLDKLSKTHLTNLSSSKKSSLSAPEESSAGTYYFSGTLLSIDQAYNKYAMNTRIYLSEPMLKMLTTDTNYSFVNWQSFTKLPNSQVRALYFYFCLNVKVSRYFHDFTVDKILDNMYISSPNTPAIKKHRIYYIRKLFQRLYDYRKDLIDFTFELVYSYTSSRKSISHIRVRRSKVFLLN